MNIFHKRIFAVVQPDDKCAVKVDSELAMQLFVVSLIWRCVVQSNLRSKII